MYMVADITDRDKDMADAKHKAFVIKLDECRNIMNYIFEQTTVSLCYYSSLKKAKDMRNYLNDSYKGADMYSDSIRHYGIGLLEVR